MKGLLQKSIQRPSWIQMCSVSEQDTSSQPVCFPCHIHQSFCYQPQHFLCTHQCATTQGSLHDTCLHTRKHVPVLNTILFFPKASFSPGRSLQQSTPLSSLAIRPQIFLQGSFLALGATQQSLHQEVLDVSYSMNGLHRQPKKKAPGTEEEGGQDDAEKQL